MHRGHLIFTVPAICAPALLWVASGGLFTRLDSQLAVLLPDRAPDPADESWRPPMAAGRATRRAAGPVRTDMPKISHLIWHHAAYGKAVRSPKTSGPYRHDAPPVRFVVCGCREKVRRGGDCQAPQKTPKAQHGGWARVCPRFRGTGCFCSCSTTYTQIVCGMVSSVG